MGKKDNTDNFEEEQIETQTLAIEEQISKIDFSQINKLNFGTNKKEDFINININEENKSDMVFDINNPWPFSDNSMELITVDNLFNQLSKDETIKFLYESYRVLKSQGELSHITIPFDKDNIHGDSLQDSFCNIYAWKYKFIYPDYKDLYGFKFNFKPIELFIENNIINCTYEVIK